MVRKDWAPHRRVKLTISLKQTISQLIVIMPALRKLARKTAQKVFGERIAHINNRRSTMEHLFHAPPFTSELVRTIKLISPHLNLKADERDRLPE